MTRKLLETGSCKRGHPIRSDADCYIYEGKTKQGYRTYRCCAKCKSLRTRDDYPARNEMRRVKAARPKLHGDRGRVAHLDCGHTPLFDNGKPTDPRGIPHPGDLLWCVKCDAGAEVVKVRLAALL